MDKNEKTLRTRPLIALWDDKESVLQDFRDNHSQYYDIFATQDGNEFYTKLCELSKQHTPPDVIVIDISHQTIDIPPDVKEKLDQDEENVRAAIKELNDFYNMYHEKVGLGMIESARDLFPDIPITAYTSQFGTGALTNENLVQLSDQNCSLLLKDRPPRYVHTRLDKMMAEAKKAKQYARITMYTSLILVCTRFYFYLYVFMVAWL